MNLEKGYRPTGDFIIEDADYQSAGIPSLCVEVCPTFYRDWTIPELVMPVHDMSRSVTALIGALVDLPSKARIGFTPGKEVSRRPSHDPCAGIISPRRKEPALGVSSHE